MTAPQHVTHNDYSDDGDRRFSGRAILGAIVVVVALVLAVGILGFGWFGIVDKDKVGDPKNPNPDTHLSDGAKNDLKVVQGAIADGAKCPDGSYNYDVQVATHTPLAFSDALGTSIEGLSPQDGLKKVLEWNCKDPHQLLGYDYLLAHTMIDTGQSLADVNPWLQPFNGEPTEKVSRDVRGTKVTVSQSQSQQYEFYGNFPETGQVTDGYKALAELTNTLLLRFYVRGIESKQSLLNVSTADHNLAVGVLPGLSWGHPENLPAIILEVRDKGQTCSPLQLGINVKDQRPEVLGKEVCVSATPTPTSAPPPPPGSTPPGTTTTQSTCKYPCNTTSTSTTPTTPSTSTTTTTTQTTTTTTQTTSTLPPKTPTHNPEQPEGETVHPSPTGNETVAPVESNPAGTTPQIPTSNPTHNPPATVPVELPPATVTQTTVIADPGE